MDDCLGCEDVDLHQIDERRPAREEHGSRSGAHGPRGLLRGPRPLKVEGLHDGSCLPSTRLTPDRVKAAHDALVGRPRLSE